MSLEKILRNIHRSGHKSQPKFKSYDYDSKYVEKNLIAYIGNKRRLLDLILAGIQEVETRGGQPVDRNGLFVDYFSGTGVVSRLMKSLGFNVIANDWEYYSYCLNRGFLECSEKDLDLFEDEGGIEEVLTELNALTQEIPAQAYISRYYCPENDKTPDPKHERLFYTRKNGILIDNIRVAIAERYGNSPEDIKKRDILLSLLLVQASKRSNTSGVFKAFHHGFGGKKRDALTRILSSVALERPTLSDNSNHSTATCYDALELAQLLKKTPAEIVYLDPPYNQHQYGSNYHLLNTISRNDQPQVNKDFWIKGKKVDKGAIRKDWIRTKSGFCYLTTACQEFSQLIKDIHSKYILVSYSSEGIISLEDMIRILAGKGKIGIITRSYVRYRGGRQANHTQKRNLEFILIVDTSIPSTEKDIENVKAIFLSSSLQNLFSDFIPLRELIVNPIPGFSVNLSDGEYSLEILGSGLIDKANGKNLCLQIDRRLFVDKRDLSQIRKLNFSQQQKIIQCCSDILVRPNYVKVAQLYDFLTDCDYQDKELWDHSFLFKEFERFFRKINFRKIPELEISFYKKYAVLKKLMRSPQMT